MGAWRGPLGVPAPSAWGWGGPLGARIGPLGMVALFARDLGGPLDAQGGPLVVLARSARGWGTLREHCKPWGHLGSLLTLWGCWYPWPWPGDPPARPPPPVWLWGTPLGGPAGAPPSSLPPSTLGSLCWGGLPVPPSRARHPRGLAPQDHTGPQALSAVGCRHGSPPVRTMGCCH